MAVQMKTAEKAPQMKIKPDVRDLRTTKEMMKGKWGEVLARTGR